MVRGPAVQAVYATGVVEPVHWAKVAPTIVELIAEVIKRDGDAVKRGDILARLDDREAKAKLARLQAAAKFTKEELERYEELARRNIASRQIFERARRDYIQAISAVAAGKERLNDYVLVSPLDGIVLRHDGEVGETVKPGDIVFWVGKRLPLRIIAEVDEEDIPLVRPGQEALLTADAFAKLVFGGQVKEITPKGDPINKNYRVRITIPDNTPLQIGMTTEVQHRHQGSEARLAGSLHSTARRYRLPRRPRPRQTAHRQDRHRRRPAGPDRERAEGRRPGYRKSTRGFGRR